MLTFLDKLTEPTNLPLPCSCPPHNRRRLCLRPDLRTPRESRPHVARYAPGGSDRCSHHRHQPGDLGPVESPSGMASSQSLFHQRGRLSSPVEQCRRRVQPPEPQAPRYEHACSVLQRHEAYVFIKTPSSYFHPINSIKVHDEIGRGNFLALYMAAGVMGSFTSLAAHALTGQLAVTSLGASGAIAGLIAAFCVLNAE